jgi:hypothetical protein
VIFKLFAKKKKKGKWGGIGQGVTDLKRKVKTTPSFIFFPSAQKRNEEKLKKRKINQPRKRG